jgi:DNA-binding CsgD family transcriptional regulator
MADSNPLYKRRSKRARTLGPKEAKALNELADLRRRQRKAARRSSQSISTLELAMKLNLDRLASAPSKES